MRGAINWGLPLLTLAVYAYLGLYLSGQLMHHATGEIPLDFRAFGYSLGEARDYLRALSPEGFALAQGPVFWADMVFSTLIGLTLTWWMRPFSGVFGMVCVLTAMTYVALDWGENAAVQAMLTAGPDWVEPAEILRASTFTSAKFVALALGVILAARQSWRRWAGRV
ncbi:hypothetical protein [Pararhodobacter sp.]|uniref:hypothetical protein n=1 Tax=Pararhodobacter sp. TaxID=2127056 RepID=UPI002AFFFB3F|nr:hypothetical protein [Pararhodobacter sp.]